MSKTQKTATKKTTSRKSSSRKKVSKNPLTRQDLLAIAKLAKLSISTLVKWNEGKLNVKPAIELKIFAAADRFFEQEELRLNELVQKLTVIEERIAARKTAIDGWVKGRIKKPSSN